MLRYVFAIGAVVALALGGVILSNLVHDRGAAGVSRRIAPVMGGAAYLAAIMWLDLPTAASVLGALTLLVVTLRLGFRHWLRGVKGNRRSQDWSEITYPVAATVSVVVGWGLVGDKWLGFMPVAFLAWGDSAAGLVRDMWERVSRLWPLAAMLVVCLGAAALMQPYWIGAVGALVATAAERYRPPLPFWDDNLNLVLASFAAMAALGVATA